jgi:acyl-CoA thioesterase FadM
VAAVTSRDSSSVFEYEVVEASNGRLVADGRSVQVMFDYEAQRSRPVPADFTARVARFEA